MQRIEGMLMTLPVVWKGWDGHPAETEDPLLETTIAEGQVAAVNYLFITATVHMMTLSLTQPGSTS